MRRLIPILAIIAALWSIAPVASIAAPPKPPTDAMIMMAPPTPAPDAVYMTAEGEETTLQALKGRLAIVNFWATWCAPCKREMPHLNSLAKTLDSDDFAVIAISVDRSQAKAAKWLEDFGMDALPAFHDGKRQLAQAFELRGMPTTYILDADGMTVAKLEGIAEWDSDEFVAWFKALAGK